MQELHYGSRRRDVVQGARGPRHVLYKRHVPQTPRLSNLVLFRTKNRRCGGYSPSDSNPLQRCQRDTPIHQCDGSGSEKIQAGKTHHHDEYMQNVALNCCSDQVSTKRKHGIVQNSRNTRKPGGRGRRPSGKHMLQRDASKPPGRGKKNPLLVPQYLVLKQKRQRTRNYGGAGIQQQRGQTFS